MASGDPGTDAAQLARTLRWLIAVALTITLVAATADRIWGGPSLVAITVISAMLGVWLIIATRAPLFRSRPARTALAAATGLLVAAFPFAIVAPEASYGLAVLPLLAVAMLLPFVEERSLLGLMVAGWSTALLIGWGGELQRLGSSSVIRVGGLATAMALMLYLLWRASARLRLAFDRLSQANVALRAVDDRLTVVNEELRLNLVELEHRNREITSLTELGDLLQVCETTEEVALALARSAPNLFPGDAGALYELRTASGALVAIATWGDPPPARRDFLATQCWALRRGRIHVVDDSGTELRCGHAEEPIQTGILCVPLVAQGETLGLLHLQVRKSAPTKEQRAALIAAREWLTQALADQVELTLANIRMRATLREQSIRDELTGLFNRRFMEETLDREIRRGKREGHQLGLMMIDLDHFKDFNDGFGHAAGDVVLRSIGQFLQTAIRGGDVACRLGGEEFVLILPKAAPEDTRRRAEALREGVKHLRLDPSGAVLPTVTMSIGIATAPDHGETGEYLLRAADEALYKAKAAGRDRVVEVDLESRPAIGVFGR
jgi:diguanylate cyclase (GGDEF)-like protein